MPSPLPPLESTPRYPITKLELELIDDAIGDLTSLAETLRRNDPASADRLEARIRMLLAATAGTRQRPPLL